MKVFRDIAGYLSWRLAQTGTGRTIGFVPTLGGLHPGHESLMQRAREENDLLVVSIFKNPTQFNDPGDLEHYPDNREEDHAAARRCGADVIFSPEPDAIYPDDYQFRVEERQITRMLEGRERPGHFEGVLTVVLKLLLIIRADRAYFGKKDYQQLVLIQRLSEAFFVGTEIVPCETIRDADGLAYSSRNALLSEEERGKAAQFPQILKHAGSPEQAHRELESAGFDVDYVDQWAGRILGAVRLGSVRLIDNFPMEAATLGEPVQMQRGARS